MFKITKKKIAMLERIGACPGAMYWLKREERTLRELLEYSENWYIWYLGHAKIPILIDINTKDNTNTSALIWAIDDELFSHAQWLIDNGADINIKYENDGKTILMDGCVIGEIRKVKFALKNNAKTGLKNKHGETALQLAIKEENFQCAKLIQEYNKSK